MPEDDVCEGFCIGELGNLGDILEKEWTQAQGGAHCWLETCSDTALESSDEDVLDVLSALVKSADVALSAGALAEESAEDVSENVADDVEAADDKVSLVLDVLLVLLMLLSIADAAAAPRGWMLVGKCKPVPVRTASTSLTVTDIPSGATKIGGS